MCLTKDEAQCSDIWLIAALTFPWSGYHHICHSVRDFTGINPCHILPKALWFNLKVLKPSIFPARQLLSFRWTRSLLLILWRCSVRSPPLQTKLSSYSLILRVKSVTGDDPRVVDEIISVTVSAKAWASGDLCRLSPDCYFLPSVTLLTELSSSAAFFPAASAAWKLQRGRLFTSHAIHEESEKPGCIHKQWLPQRCSDPDLKIGRLWRCCHSVDPGEWDALYSGSLRYSFPRRLLEMPPLWPGEVALSSTAADSHKQDTAASERPHSGPVLTINLVATGGCLSQDAALPREEDPEAVQAPAAAGTAHLRRVVHVPAHQPGQDHQTPLQLRER